MQTNNVFDMARKRAEKLAAEHIEVEIVFENEVDIDLIFPHSTCLTMLQDCVEAIGVVGVYQELITCKA